MPYITKPDIYKDINLQVNSQYIPLFILYISFLLFVK